MISQRQNSTSLTKGAKILQALLVLLVVYLLTRAIIAFVTPESLWKMPAPSAPVISAQSSQASPKYSFTFDPFHRGTAPAPAELGQDAPETTLNLKLFGLRSGENGSAILQTPDNKQGVYSAGDEIINGVVLKSISPDFIVLSINGKLERLTFVRGEDSALRAVPEAEPKISAEMFMREVDVKPAMTDGVRQGFRVSSRFGAGKLSRYGLQDGDILLSLGGTDLTRGQPDWRAISENLSGAREINAKINRGGNIMNVKVKM